MKVVSSVSNNSCKNPYAFQKQRKVCNFKGYNFVKTLEKADIDSIDVKYFKKGVPAFAKHVPQSFFCVRKYLNEATRFLGTDGVGCCTKLTMHDPVTQTGLLAHVDSVERLLNVFSVRNIQKALFDVNPENLFVRHLRGSFYRTEDSMLGATLEFMQKLKIPAKNLIEQDLFSHKEGATGLLMDIKTGQTYNISIIPSLKPHELDMYEKNLTPEEYKILLKNRRNTDTVRDYRAYLSNIDE